MNDEQRKAIHAKKNGGSGVSSKDFKKYIAFDEHESSLAIIKGNSLKEIKNQFRIWGYDNMMFTIKKTAIDGEYKAGSWRIVNTIKHPEIIEQSEQWERLANEDED